MTKIIKFFTILILTLQFSGSSLFAQYIDSCGNDNNLHINAYEANFQNNYFVSKRGSFDFNNAKIGYFFGPNGQHLGCKKMFFNYVKRKGTNSSVSSHIIIFSSKDKQKSGGYDAVVVSWSKFRRKEPTREMLKRLSQSKFEYQICND